jgi:predicted GIY-YIG superfamily endonuclease
MTILSHYASNGNPQVYSVYALIDPRGDKSIRYIGITNDVYRRFCEHIKCSGTNQAKNTWIQELQAEQVMVIMQTLISGQTFTQAKQLEDEWIHRLLKEGCSLLNIEGTERAEPKVRTCVQKTGRQFDKEEVGEIIVYRLIYGYWPDGLSRKMCLYYERHYLNSGGKFYWKAREWRAQAKEYKTASQAS